MYKKKKKNFLIKFIQKIIDMYYYQKEKGYYETFNDDYTENIDYKFIFGVISYDDLSYNKPNLLTMNDLDVLYNKHNKTYSWDIECVYSFPNKEGKKKYLKRLLKCFTKFMKEHNYNTELDGFYTIFSNVNEFDTIEECYANFKYCVNGYINS